MDCGHYHNTPLKYQLDDWGYKGATVWYEDQNGNQHSGQLTLCLDCGAVFVKDIILND